MEAYPEPAISRTGARPRTSQPGIGTFPICEADRQHAPHSLAAKTIPRLGQTATAPTIPAIQHFGSFQSTTRRWVMQSPRPSESPRFDRPQLALPGALHIDFNSPLNGKRTPLQTERSTSVIRVANRYPPQCDDDRGPTERPVSRRPLATIEVQPIWIVCRPRSTPLKTVHRINLPRDNHGEPVLPHSQMLPGIELLASPRCSPTLRLRLTCVDCISGRVWRRLRLGSCG